MRVSVGSGVDVAMDTTVNLPAEDTRLSCFNTQPRAEGFKAGVFQQLHCCQKKASSKFIHITFGSAVKCEGVLMQLLGGSSRKPS